MKMNSENSNGAGRGSNRQGSGNERGRGRGNGASGRGSGNGALGRGNGNAAPGRGNGNPAPGKENGNLSLERGNGNPARRRRGAPALNLGNGAGGAQNPTLQTIEALSAQEVRRLQPVLHPLRENGALWQVMSLNLRVLALHFCTF